MFVFLDSKLEDQRFCTEWMQALPDFNPPLISSYAVYNDSLVGFLQNILRLLNHE